MKKISWPTECILEELYSMDFVIFTAYYKSYSLTVILEEIHWYPLLMVTTVETLPLGAAVLH
jgi:hypothetical protein